MLPGETSWPHPVQILAPRKGTKKCAFGLAGRESPNSPQGWESLGERGSVSSEATGKRVACGDVQPASPLQHSSMGEKAPV